MSETPRTDAEITCVGIDGDGDAYLHAAFARELERELTASKAEVERLREFITSIIPPPPYGELEPEWKYAQKLLARLAPAPEEQITLNNTAINAQ